MKVGEKIRKIRELKGFKQEYMAKELGIAQPNYSKLESDKADITLSQLEDIANILDVKIKDLLNFDCNFFLNSTLSNSPISNSPVSINDAKNFEEIMKAKDEVIESQKEIINLLKKHIQFLEDSSKQTI